jgi:putative sigma-54 modulation protein
MQINMKLQMHSIHFDADRKLIDFIQKKADKLDTFYDQIIDGEVFMRIDKNDNKANKIVEIKLNVPGKQFFAKNQSDSFEAAADEAVEGLRRQIKKYKEKLVLARQ